MGMGKLKKFAELEQMSNVFEKPKPGDLHGKWKEVFRNENPIVLELACGKGDYTLALAQRFRERNFIGVDIKGHRLHVGARKALKEELDNVRFMRIFIDHIDQYFDKNEVDEIWITFPDPFLRKSKANRRLTAPQFLELYRKVLKPGGTIQLKTDSPELFEYTQEVIADQSLPIVKIHQNIYQENDVDPLLTDIQTHYEKMHLKDDRIIRAIKFQLNS